MALRKKGVLSVEGEGSTRLISDYRQLRQAQTALTRELGLSPASRQAIRANGTSAALDLAGMLAAQDGADDINPASQAKDAPGGESVGGKRYA